MAVLRSTVGGVFVGHGLQKLTGAFGGHGLDATGEAFESMGLRPGRTAAMAAGLSETVGGGLVAAGLLTPVGTTMITGTMVTAIEKVHKGKGPWATEGGYEYNAVLISAAFAIAEAGPGKYSLDRVLGTEHHGPLLALASLAGGALGAMAFTRFGPRAAGDETQAPTADGAAQARDDGAHADRDTAGTPAPGA